MTDAEIDEAINNLEVQTQRRAMNQDAPLGPLLGARNRLRAMLRAVEPAAPAHGALDELRAKVEQSHILARTAAGIASQMPVVRLQWLLAEIDRLRGGVGEK
jgi:hypothetical protein